MLRFIIYFLGLNSLLIAGPVKITNLVDGKGIVLGTGTYESGTQISLKAVPQVDWKFEKWEGVPDTQKDQNPIQINADKVLFPKAIFVLSEGQGRFHGGRVVASGMNSSGQCNPPEDLNDAIAIAAGEHHTLALKKNGVIVGWGGNRNGQITIPTGLSSVVGISAQRDTSVAVNKYGNIQVWGEYIINPPQDSSAIKVQANGASIVVLNSKGVVSQFGPSSYNLPNNINGVSDIVGGYSHSLAIKNDGTVIAWGWNQDGQTNVPAFINRVVRVAAGDNHSMALDENGKIFAWGDSLSDAISIPASLGEVVEIAAGNRINTALKSDGKIVVWGGRWGGEDAFAASLKNVVKIACGLMHRVYIVCDYIAFLEKDLNILIVELGDQVQLKKRVAGYESLQWFSSERQLLGETGLNIKVDTSKQGEQFYRLLGSSGNSSFFSAPTRVVVLPVGCPRLAVNGVETLDAIRIGRQASISVSTSFTQGQIFYTLDGSTPGLDSTPYTKPFDITNSIVFRACSLSSDFTSEVISEPVSVQIVPSYQLIESVVGSGHVERSTSVDGYLQDDVLRIRAEPNDGWRFLRWEGDLQGAFPERNLVMNRDKYVRAIFEAVPTFNLKVQARGGSVTGGGIYYDGTRVNFSALSTSNWNFLNWNGDFVGTETNFDWVVNGSATFEAKFGTKVSTLATGNGKVRLEPDQSLYPYGSQVKVIPIPDDGSYLALWGEAGAGQPRTEWVLTVTNEAPRVTALFRALAFDRVALTGQSTLGGRISQPAVDGLYTMGNFVTITAVPDVGYEFAGWDGDAVGAEPSVTLTLDSSKTVKAGFRKVGVASYPVTVAITGPGTVRRIPDLGAYEAGSEVELVAEPTGGSLFAGWTGAVINSQKRVRISVTGSVSATATFKAVYPVATEARGEGQILLSPPDANYPEGTVVALTAKPAEGWGFVQWSGDISTTAQEAGVTVDAPKRVIAEFARLGTLTTKVVGSGTVSRMPDGQSFLPGTAVTLTAQAQAGWRFLRWSGGASGTNATTSVVVGRTEAIVAEFIDGEPPVLTVTQPVSGTVEDQRFSLSGTASDAVSLRGVRWAWNGISKGYLPLSAGGFSVGNLNLYMGTNLIEVTAEDTAGNVSVVRREVVWKPLRTLIAGSAVEVQEGQRIVFPISMVSTGDVGGLTFKLNYNAAFLTDPKVEWSAVVGQSVNTVNTSVAGEISGSFSLAGIALPSGTVSLGTVNFRARSVPMATNAVLNPVIVSVGNPSGGSLSTGNGAIAGEGRIRLRRIKGDNNANQRVDIGDATVISRLLVALDETRTWDVTLNDLNGTGDLDNGDVIKSLRTVVGMDPQPGPMGMGKRLLPALPIEPSPVSTNYSAELTLLDGPAIKVGQPYRVAVRLKAGRGNLTGLSFSLKYPASLELKDKVIGAEIPADALPAWNISRSRAKLAVIRPKSWVAQSGAVATFIFQPTLEATKQTKLPISLEEVEVSDVGEGLSAVPSVWLEIGGGLEFVPQLRVMRTSADALSLEILGPKGLPLSLESSDDLSDWVETQQVTGLGTSTPVKVTLQTDPNVQAKFWRVRVR
jgi:hypothetical protein